MLLVQSVVGGYLARHLAEQKGYEGHFWLGFVFGVLGVAYVAGLPISEEMREREMEDFVRRLREREVACPACGQVQRADRLVCFKCGAQFIQNMEKEDDADDNE